MPINPLILMYENKESKRKIYKNYSNYNEKTNDFILIKGNRKRKEEEISNEILH